MKLEQIIEKAENEFKKQLLLLKEGKGNVWKCMEVECALRFLYEIQPRRA